MTVRRDDVLSGVGGLGRTSVSVGPGAMLANPLVDACGALDLALGEIGYGLKEAGAADDLVCALPADSTETDAHLVGADEAQSG